MSIHVPDLLIKASAHPERVTPVDIVMGDHWAEIDLGNPMRLSLLRAVLKKQEQGPAPKGGGGRSARLRLPLSIVNRSPQAMVKVVRKGGTINARGMRDQMAYLSKDGDARLERSERYFGIELDEGAQERLRRSWGLAGETKTRSDKTTHFVVSFPRGTDHRAAYCAGRSWAEEMFASGTYGDVFDYYTAFHTDRAHPHMHVVVNRRGMENGDWLKVSRRSAFNYDELRAMQVEVAAREGIHLEATPRLSRGLTDRPAPDAEIRRAERERREPQAPSHTQVTALRSAATVVLYSQQMTADATLLREHHPELSVMIGKMAGIILAGQAVPAASPNERPHLTLNEARRQSEFIMSRRREILAGIREIDAEISTIPIGKERSQLEQDASRIKAEAAEFIPDAVELSGHMRTNTKGYYLGIEARDGIERELKERADREAGQLALAAGIDPEKFTSRFAGSRPASQELADTWRKDELEDIQKNLTYQPVTPPDKQRQLAQAAYDDLHRNALQTYRKAERELDAHAARKKELHRIARLIREGRRLGIDTENVFQKTVKETLHTVELRELEAGKPRAFRHVTQDADQQRALSRRYLEAEQRDAEGARKLQLTAALATIERDADLAAQRSGGTSRKDRGLDR
ncbi:MAG: relaxase/mobilization nuclease domain-containing protein [Ahrensia sp.]|nr:relaxase/mobilization nuclease domain-containing protein [Ahrensia sp.]